MRLKTNTGQVWANSGITSIYFTHGAKAFAIEIYTWTHFKSITCFQIKNTPSYEFSLVGFIAAVNSIGYVQLPSGDYAKFHILSVTADGYPTFAWVTYRFFP